MSALTDYIDLELKRRRIQIIDFAAEVGITPQSYYKWRRGEGNPKLSNIKKIASILDVPTSTLLDIQDGILQPETEKAATPEDDGKEDSKLMSIARQLEQVSLRFALYGDPAEDVTESDLDAIREYARYIRDKKK